MAKESYYRRNEGFVHFKILKKEAKKKKINKFDTGTLTQKIHRRIY